MIYIETYSTLPKNSLEKYLQKAVRHDLENAIADDDFMSEVAERLKALIKRLGERYPRCSEYEVVCYESEQRCYLSFNDDTTIMNKCCYVRRRVSTGNCVEVRSTKILRDLRKIKIEKEESYDI